MFRVCQKIYVMYTQYHACMQYKYKYIYMYRLNVCVIIYQFLGSRIPFAALTLFVSYVQKYILVSINTCSINNFHFLV